MSINRVCISGNLTRDPDLRSTQGGTPVLRMGVAVNERRKNPQTGEWEDYPNFIDCAMFGTRAEKLAQYLAKGTKVAIDGRLRYSSWEKDGERRSKLEVVVDEIEFMTRGGSQSQAPQSQAPQAQASQAQASQAQAPYRAPAPAQAPDLYDADIPF